jgi:hypothetical protein
MKILPHVVRHLPWSPECHESHPTILMLPCCKEAQANLPKDVYGEALRLHKQRERDAFPGCLSSSAWRSGKPLLEMTHEPNLKTRGTAT